MNTNHLLAIGPRFGGLSRFHARRPQPFDPHARSLFRSRRYLFLRGRSGRIIYGQLGNDIISSSSTPVPVMDLAADPGIDWQKLYFTVDSGNPSIAGWTADPDHDGVINLLERAFNLNPLAASAAILAPNTGTAGLPRIATIPGPDGNRLSIQYLRFKASVLSGLAYTPQVSSTLENGGWRTVIGTETVQSIDDTWERVILTEIPTGQPIRFARIMVNRIGD